MTRSNYKIFSEGRIANLLLKNRLVRSATCEYKMEETGRITDIVLSVYKNLAAGGVGLIISSLMAVAANGKGVKDQICIYSDEFINDIAKIAAIVHQIDTGCAIIAQLCHAGRQVTYDNQVAECVGPSAVASPLLVKTARELTNHEIERIIHNFVEAIIRVKCAGFDGAQLHAAHGYLLSSFLSPYTNKRTDAYGGSIQNRSRIIKDIVSLARKEVGSFPILIKANCDDHVMGGITKDDFPALAKELALAGVDAIEVSGGMWDCLTRSEHELGFRSVPLPESRTGIDTVDKQSYYYDYIARVHAELPLILVGGNRNVESMERLLQAGKVDFLALSRPLIAEPGLPNRWRDGVGRETTACVSCNACLVFKEEYGCALRRLGLQREVFAERLAKAWRNSFK
ncbi:NADH:flavin oxidoreductase [Sporomusa sp. KB1]|uniref:oxidoreductase n=1 Tax=Sporomusa sp. KB1 TaxID=943346 RepID=UPI0011AC53BF|nr:NADH:flavin oxidoreductase [Sporomusa sp. KB1]TWH47571.1 2,4-dienoyl-CoA reductase-like NADH-dependent reductase (Old Yellow Enzyme family) [Sporomusa sp. KB1]